MLIVDIKYGGKLNMQSTASGLGQFSPKPTLLKPTLLKPTLSSCL